ncbi:MAG: hypothetical protein AAF713_18530 [Pseudomonadota bacterium]
MAFHRKAEALMRLRPDLAVISECAAPSVLTARGLGEVAGETAVWIGNNPNKGLGVFAFNGYRVRLAKGHRPTLRHIAPVHVDGPLGFHLLAVWAQNASGGITRKHQLGPLRRALSAYRGFLTAAPAVVGGDFNNNVFWDRPGWRINHRAVVERLETMGLQSAYHTIRGEAQGEETVPTHYWRDRRKDGPTYHIDYVFAPVLWLEAVIAFRVGRFEDWCGPGMSDHVPILVEFDI